MKVKKVWYKNGYRFNWALRKSSNERMEGMGKKGPIKRWNIQDLERTVRLYKEYSSCMKVSVGHSEVCRYVSGVMGESSTRIENGLMNHVDTHKYPPWITDEEYLIAKEWQCSKAKGRIAGTNPLPKKAVEKEEVEEVGVIDADEIDVVTETSKHIGVHESDFLNPEVFTVLENVSKYCDELEAKLEEQRTLSQEKADLEQRIKVMEEAVDRQQDMIDGQSTELSYKVERIEELLGKSNELEAIIDRRDAKIKSLKDREFEMSAVLKQQQKRVESDFLTKMESRFGGAVPRQET